MEIMRNVAPSCVNGVSPTTSMTHIAIQKQLDGNAVDWLEQVSDGQYPK